MTIKNIKKIIFFCIAILATPFHFSSALAEYSSFGASIVLNDACVPVVSFDLTVMPSSMTTGNVFVFALNKVDDQGTVLQSQDYPINVPANGVINDTTFLANGFSGAGNFTVRVIENQSNMAFVGQTNPILVASSAGTCSSAGGDQGVDTNVGDFSSLEQMEIPIENPINVTSIPQLIKKVLEAMIKIGIPLLVIMIIYSGALYLFARGNQSKIQDAHTMFLYTLIGGAILLGAWALSELIYDTLIDLTAFVLKTFV
jgi:hypothetical protein